MECDDLSFRGSLIPKITLLSQKLLPSGPILRPIQIFQQNRKQFSIFLKIAIGTHKQSYKDPICKISSLYVVWFDLQALSYLTGSFLEFFLLYSLLNMKAAVDRTKQHRDLKFCTQGCCRIANDYLSPFLKEMKTTSGFVENSKLAAKQALQATVFDLGG